MKDHHRTRLINYLYASVHHVAHFPGAGGLPTVAVEVLVQPPRRHGRRHVDEGVALVVPRPGHKTKQRNQTGVGDGSKESDWTKTKKPSEEIALMIVWKVNAREGKETASVLEVDREVEEIVLRLYGVAGEVGVLLGAVLVEDSHESLLPATQCPR